ncbi:MAG: hypothetical protein GC158_01275 [Cyanobacteria bacterium RI_101]|nr:hypothetical protein [Cyanobacteria bacterium RI_101]
MKRQFLLALGLTVGAFPSAVWSQAPKTINYLCAGNQSLTVALTEEQATLTLPDKSAVTLPKATSASGAKYSNGSLTFWSKGNTAFVEQGETMILKDCVTIPE